MPGDKSRPLEAPIQVELAEAEILADLLYPVCSVLLPEKERAST